MRRMNVSVERAIIDVNSYLAAPSVHLPVFFPKTVFTLTELSLQCGDCGKRLEDIRGYLFEDEHFVFVDVGGVCNSCNRVSSFLLVVDTENGNVYRYTDDGIEELRIHKQFGATTNIMQ